jgi:hypothetical protein
VTNELGASQQEFLIRLSSERLARVEQALERNWVVQLILAGVGLALVFDIGDLPKLLSRYFLSQQDYNLRPVAAIFLAILLYYFMKLGQLLTRFIENRQLNDWLLEGYLGEKKGALEALRVTESFFEVFYAPQAFRKPLVVAYYIISTITISTGQAASLYLMFKAYGRDPWSVAVMFLAVVIMTLLYLGFWGSKKKHPGTTKVVLACGGMTILLFIVFLAYAPPPKEDPLLTHTPPTGSPGLPESGRSPD